MRFECKITTAKGTAGVSGKRPVKAVVTLMKTRMKGSNHLVMKCALANSKRDITEALTKDNVTNVISTHVPAGKITLICKQDTYFLCDCDTRALRRFLDSIIKSREGLDVSLKSDPIAPSLGPKKLSLTTKEMVKEYNRQGYPSTIVILEITNVTLPSVCPAWFGLSKMEVLDLTGAVFVSDTLNEHQLFSRLLLLKRLSNLRELNLSRTNIPVKFLQLPPSLLSLDLSENAIGHIPPEVCELPNLKVLKVRNCNLKSVPIELGLIRSLRTLDISRNEFSSLPGTLINLRLDYFGLADGNYQPNLVEVKIRPKVPLLVHLAWAVLKHYTKEKYSSWLPWNVRIQSTSALCLCYRCFKTCPRDILFVKTEIIDVLSFCQSVDFRDGVPMEFRLCPNCFR